MVLALNMLTRAITEGDEDGDDKLERDADSVGGESIGVTNWFCHVGVGGKNLLTYVCEYETLLNSSC